MRFVRLLVHGIPLLLVALFVASLINATQLKTRKKNEFSYGSLGEPTKLNPIQSSDAAATDIETMVFQSLITLDGDLELTTVLAKSYEQIQETTFFFENETDAAAAANAIEAARSSWKDWTVTGAQRSESSLIVTHTLPGYRISDSIGSTLENLHPIPLLTLRAETGGDARKVLEEFRNAHPKIAIEREWFDYDFAFEITVRDIDNPEARLKEFLATRGAPPLAERGRRSYLAEPLLRFQLRDDVRWHDGVPFTSADCVFTYDAIMDEKTVSPVKSDFDSIGSVSAPGPYEFVVRYREPYSPAILSWTTLLLPKHILEGKSQDWWNTNFNRHPIGTGPFKFDSWQTNQSVRLVRNTDYWGIGPWLDALEFRSMPDPTIMRLAFESHQLDLFEVSITPWALKAYRSDPRFTTLTIPGFNYNYIGWNLRKPIFRDQRVREALALGLDVASIIKYLSYGAGTQSTGIFVPEFWFASKDIQPLPYDPDAARRLLDEAGWKPGPDGIRQKDGNRLSFKIITNQGNEVRKDIATLAQDSYRKLGIEVRIEIYEWAVFIERFVKKNEFDALVLGWITPPNWDQFVLWHSSQTKQDLLNYTGYQNPRTDELLLALREEYDRERIAELASELQELIYHDQPMAFLEARNNSYAIWKDSLRIRQRDDGHWIDEPFRVAPVTWDYFLPVTYRTDFASQLPKESTEAK